MINALQTGEVLETIEMKNLQEAYLKNEVISGTVCSVQKKVNEEGKPTEFAVLDFNGIQGICEKKDFDSHQFKSLAGFVGHQVDVMIKSINMKDKFVTVDRVEALEKLQEEFWEKARVGQIVRGKISGWNEKTQNLFILISGVTCYMHIRDWSYEYVSDVKNIGDLGKEVRVKIIELDKFNSRIRVSRKDILSDPWINAEEIYRPDDLHLGKVTTVHPVHGVFVKLREGLEILCYVARKLSKPFEGQTVTIKINRVDSTNRRGRGIIVNYPHGRSNYVSSQLK